MTALFPAPWNLEGQGYVFVYRFSRDFIARQGMIPKHLQASFVGGFGAVMLVNYSSSNCGPYQELLFIPGSFRVDGRNYPSITRILVSTQVSVVNGRVNWGIPKDQADFKVLAEADGSETWQVHRQGQKIFQARMSTGRVPIPLHTAVVPHVVMHSWEKKTFLTNLSAKGWGRPARLLEVQGDGQNFPDLRDQKPFLGMGMKVESFKMKFSEASILTEPSK